MEPLLHRPFEALAEGERFATPGRTVTEADVQAFAALTGDHHPQHVDAAWAAGSRFGERIAHGMLVASCAVGLVGFDPQRVVALRRVRDLVFKRPVALGDTIRVEGAIESLAGMPGEAGLVAVALRVLDQDDRLAARMVVEVLWRGDAPGAVADAPAGALAVPR